MKWMKKSKWMNELFYTVMTQCRLCPHVAWTLLLFVSVLVSSRLSVSSGLMCVYLRGRLWLWWGTWVQGNLLCFQLCWERCRSKKDLSRSRYRHKLCASLLQGCLKWFCVETVALWVKCFVVFKLNRLCTVCTGAFQTTRFPIII